MQEDIYKCTVCCKDYDLEAHIPKILNWCRHYLCLECLRNQFFKNPVQTLICPFCQESFSPSPLTPEPFATDLSLLELIRNRSKTIEGYCSKHDKKRKLFCITDKLPICSDCCKKSEGHKNHEIQPIRVLQDNTKKKKEKLKFLLEDYDAKSKKIEKEMNEKHKNTLDLIRNKFSEMRNVLAARKQELMQQAEGILRVEKEFLSEKLDRNKSKLKDQISEISQDDYQCQTLASMKQELDGYEVEFSIFGVEEIGQIEEAGSETLETLEKFGKIISGLQQNETNEKETQTIEIFEQRRLSREISTEDEDIINIKGEPLISPVRSYFVKEPADDEEDCLFLKRKATDEMEEEIEEEDDEELSVDSNEVVREIIQDAESLLTRQGRSVKIDFSKKEFTSEQLVDICSQFDLSSQGIRHFEIDFSGSSLQDNHLEVLSQNFFQKKEINELDSFVFDCSNTSIGDACFAVLKDVLSLSEETLEKFELILDSTKIEGDNICDIFSKMNQLRHLKLSFEESVIFSAGISFLFSSLRHVASHLESLDLNFNATEIDDGCIEILINDVILSMKKPTYLRISLGNTTISNKIMMQLFKILKSVTVHFTTFELDLNHTSLHNTALTHLLKDTLKEMLNLENLKLDFSGTKINNDGLKHLSLASLKLKSLSMNLNETHISDQGLEILERNIIGAKIEKIDVQLEDTFVSDDALEKFGNYLKKKTQQQQHLNTTPQRKSKRFSSESSQERENFSVFSKESTPKRKMRFRGPTYLTVSLLIKERLILDLKKALIAETGTRSKPEQISMLKLLEMIGKLNLETYNKILTHLLNKHIPVERAKTLELKDWKRKIVSWLQSFSNPIGWRSWLVANGKFSLFRERLIQILRNMPSRTFSMLRQRAVEALGEFYPKSRTLKKTLQSAQNAFSYNWWISFMTKDREIWDRWENLPSEDSLLQDE